MTTKLKGSQIKVEDIVSNPSTLSAMTSTTKAPSENAVKTLIGNGTVMKVNLSGYQYTGVYSVSDHTYDEIKTHIDNGGIVYVYTAEGRFFHLYNISIGSESGQTVYNILFYQYYYSYSTSYFSYVTCKKYPDSEIWKLTEITL